MSGVTSGAARALARLLALFAEIGPVGVVALVLDCDGETIDLCISNDDDAVEERSLLLLDLYADDAFAVLFASVRPGPPCVRKGERARYLRVSEHGHRVGLPVLDWLIVGDDDDLCSLKVGHP